MRRTLSRRVVWVSFSTIVMATTCVLTAQAQHGNLVTPKSMTAQQTRMLLDQPVQLNAFDGTVGGLEDYLQPQVESLGVFVDHRALRLAQLSPEDPLKISVAKMPLRAALRKVLSPLGLKATVDDDGLVITADFEALTRRGVATDVAFNEAGPIRQAIVQSLMKTVSVSEKERPFDEAIVRLSKQTGIPMLINSMAMEDIGLSSQEPVTIELNNTSARTALRAILRPFDMTFMIRDESLDITTLEAAETNLIGRVYYLEALGLPRGDAQAAEKFLKVIQSSIVPDTWEILGGPSTMRLHQTGLGNRPSMIVSTTSDVHQLIREMLAGLRAGSVGADPVVSRK